MCTYLYEFDSLESKAWISYYNETQETATESSAGGKKNLNPRSEGTDGYFAGIAQIMGYYASLVQGSFQTDLRPRNQSA